MKWQNLSESTNGMKEVLIIMFAKWIVMLFAAFYIDQTLSSGSRKNPLSFLKRFQKKTHLPRPDTEMQVSKVFSHMEKRRDGNPDKFAVRGLYLNMPQGECFDMLGPNGAGKTFFIDMMIGLTKPTSGATFVQGLDIRTQMIGIYTTIGVCSKYDLPWESLTGWFRYLEMEEFLPDDAVSTDLHCGVPVPLPLYL
ncbi:hypothetical protein Fmac_026344 [Flemingia macrophylla]|uniref:ABC transporter domain-containing protein n=1 Tax=Flemingia macrophylla TaxID=520843 RepID=A0ABD1LGA1_9FABA